MCTSEQAHRVEIRIEKPRRISDKSFKEGNLLAH